MSTSPFDLGRPATAREAARTQGRSLRGERDRRLRRRVIAGTLAVFVAVWLVLLLRLTAGEDPALARAKAQSDAARARAATQLLRQRAAADTAAFAFEGFVEPLTLRTYWSAAARTSSEVAGGSKLCSVRMLRHMRKSYRRLLRVPERSAARVHGMSTSPLDLGRPTTARAATRAQGRSLRGERDRRLRRRVLAGTLAVFVAVWLVLLLRLTAGDDPALARARAESDAAGARAATQVLQQRATASATASAATVRRLQAQLTAQRAAATRAEHRLASESAAAARLRQRLRAAAKASSAAAASVAATSSQAASAATPSTTSTTPSASTPSSSDTTSTATTPSTSSGSSTTSTTTSSGSTDTSSSAAPVTTSTS